MTDEITYGTMKDLKVGRFVMIDGIACRVVDIEVSAPGKHGAAKMRITGIGIFDGQKKTLLKPSSGDIEVPVITKKKAQVVFVSDTTAQVMDLESYETFDLPIPEDMKGSVKAGAEIEIMEASGRRAISRVMGG